MEESLTRAAKASKASKVSKAVRSLSVQKNAVQDFGANNPGDVGDGDVGDGRPAAGEGVPRRRVQLHHLAGTQFNGHFVLWVSFKAHIWRFFGCQTGSRHTYWVAGQDVEE